MSATADIAFTGKGCGRAALMRTAAAVTYRRRLRYQRAQLRLPIKSLPPSPSVSAVPTVGILPASAGVRSRYSKRWDGGQGDAGLFLRRPGGAVFVLPHPQGAVHG